MIMHLTCLLNLNFFYFEHNVKIYINLLNADQYYDLPTPVVQKEEEKTHLTSMQPS